MRLLMGMIGGGLDAMAGELRRQGTRAEQDVTTAIDGARTMAFIESTLESNAGGGKWMRMKDHAR